MTAPPPAHDARGRAPSDPSALEHRPVPDHAAGIPAVAQTIRATAARVGLRRGAQLLSQVNQKDGFDCPSCAWGDPEGDRSFAEFCENGAKAVADAADRARANPVFFADHSVDDLLGRSDRWLNDAGRITHPMIRRAGDTHLTPIRWETAESMVAEHVAALPTPDRAIFYTSGRASNEAAFLYQLWARALGTNNLPDCSNMCHESSGLALSPTIGIGKGTVHIADLEAADVIVVLGQNPGTNHPRMLTALQRCVRDGGTVVSVNPMAEAGLRGVVNPQDFTKPMKAVPALAGRATPLADIHLQVRIGGDLALLTGVQKALVEAGDVDVAYVVDRTSGFDELRAHLAAQPWEPLEAASGIRRTRMVELARLIGSTRKVVWCWAMGLTQHEHAVGTIQQLVNLALLRGSVGVQGGGLCPVRGHSNVQGDRTVGIWDQPTDEFLDRLDAGVGRGFTAPRAHGLDVVEAITAAGRGEVDVMVSLGGNLLQAAPDTDLTTAALGDVHLAVHITTKLNRGHLLAGQTALILPCLSRTEQDVTDAGPQRVTVESSMGVVSASAGRATPASEHLRSEARIVAGLAAATLGPRTPIDWNAHSVDLDRTRELIEASVAGFDDFNVRIREPGGFALPNRPRDGSFDDVPGGRAVMTVYPLPATEDAARGRSDAPADALTLMTVRSHDQFNTTVYGNDDRYRGVYGDRRIIFLAPADAVRLKLADGQPVDITSHARDGSTRTITDFRVVLHDLPTGDCAAYFPEANPLIPLRAVAIGSNTPTSKAIPVTLAPAARSAHG